MRLPVLDENHIVGDSGDVLGRMGDHHERRTNLDGKVAHQIKHLLPQGWSQRGKGLIQQNQRLILHQHPRKRCSALLPSGKRARFAL